MYQSILLALSLIVFILTIAYAIIKIHKEKSVTSKMIANLIGLTSISMLPLYLGGNIEAQGGIVDMIISSVLGVLRVAFGENSLSDTREVTSLFNEEYAFIISNYTAILHLVFSALLLGFIAGLFKNFYSNIIFKYFDKGALYVFSNFSKRSILLALDIREKDKKSIIVFLGKLDSKNENDSNNLEKLAAIGAHVFNFSVDEIKIPKRYYESGVHYFLLKENEEENLSDALCIARKYRGPDKKADKAADKAADKNPKQIKEKILAELSGEVSVFLLNSYTETIAVVDAIEIPTKENFKLHFRIINETRTLVYKLFDENPLFLGANDDKLKILILGGGRIGTAAAEIASWCGQTLKIIPEIILVDKDNSWEKRFEARCPELSAKTTSELAKKEAKISFYNCDIEDSDFINLMCENPDVGYVICALGDNELNIKTALKVRETYEKMLYNCNEKMNFANKLRVHLLIDAPFLSDISKSLRFDNKNKCNFIPFGGLQEIYTKENITSSYLNKLGIAVNRFYKRDQMKNKIEAADLNKKTKVISEVEAIADSEYNQKEYNRVSSISAGLHFKYKLYSALTEICGIKIDDAKWLGKPSSEMIDKLGEVLLNSDIVEELSILEHRRWNVYMRSQGWTVATTKMADKWYKTEKNTWKNFTAKMTPCLVSWDELDEVDIWLNKKSDEKSNFKEVDRVMVREVAFILNQAKEI